MELRKSQNFFPAWFDQLFNANWSNQNYSSTNTTIPSANVKEGPEQFEVELAAPGLSKKDFKIELDNDVLTVSSEKETGDELKEGESYTRHEFSYQSFRRRFLLPNSVDNEKIKAKYGEGILRVNIPKKKEAHTKPPKQIAIH